MDLPNDGWGLGVSDTKSFRPDPGLLNVKIGQASTTTTTTGSLGVILGDKIGVLEEKRGTSVFQNRIESWKHVRQERKTFHEGGGL